MIDRTGNAASDVRKYERPKVAGPHQQLHGGPFDTLLIGVRERAPAGLVGDPLHRDRAGERR